MEFWLSQRDADQIRSKSFPDFDYLVLLIMISWAPGMVNKGQILKVNKLLLFT